ncbi:MAG: MOSC domain-containing protein, partial [Bryobacteraceae bacterium]
LTPLTLSGQSNAPAHAGIVMSVQIGRAAPLGPQAVLSGFVKRPVSGAVEVTQTGLLGDEQADLRVHGGPEKAVYGYAELRYGAWRTAFPQHSALLIPGGFGENLTIAGCDETTVCLNDIVRIGTCLLQVSQPRQPCFKFALRFTDEAMPQAMVRNGYCGWYYRVLKPGRLSAEDTVSLEERPHPLWSIDRVNRQIVQRRGTPEDKSQFAAIT